VIMPGIDGFETCSRLKADLATAWIPVLFMTGLSELDDLLRGFGEGALDYIVKPIRPAEVLARIEVHLLQTRMLRRAERLLEQGEFAALAVDSEGRISWFTPAAGDWLRELAARQGRKLESGQNDVLPEKFLAWFHAWLQAAVQPGCQPDAYRQEPGFCAYINPCEYPGEFMLLLQREENNWSPEMLRDKLKLTFREAEILMWIARGKTNKEIGIILSTSPRTVNKHLEHIFEKLGVTTRAAAVAMMLKGS